MSDGEDAFPGNVNQTPEDKERTIHKSQKVKKLDEDK